ncbi:MAG: COG1470 family protein [Candidatus Heimdallarchaeaceae archaeon]
MKKLMFLALLLIPQVAFAISIQPTEWSETITAGETITKFFNITLTNETCTLSTSGLVSTWLYSLPTSFDVSGTLTLRLPITISVPSDTPGGTYTGTISYCDSNISLSIGVQGTQGAQCNLIVTILGSKERGKAMSFDVRDTNYNSKDATVYITRSDGTVERIDCTGGFCSWLIPPVEEGPIIARIIVANCSPVTKQIELTGEVVSNETQEQEVSGGKITIVGPTEVSTAENFQFLVIGKNKPLNLAEVSIVGPEGYTFSGTTNNYGIIIDSSNKVYGTEIKPDKVGEYTIFIDREGYAPTSFNFKLIRKECPYQCCIDSEYERKECEAGYECKNNRCVPIVKPKMKISCEPSRPIIFDNVTCVIRDENGNRISQNLRANFQYGNFNETLLFSNGVASFSADQAGMFKITVPDTAEYSGDTYSSMVEVPSWVSWWWVAIVIIVVIIIVIVLLIRRKGGGGPKVILESKTPTVEKVSFEK